MSARLGNVHTWISAVRIERWPGEVTTIELRAHVVGRLRSANIYGHFTRLRALGWRP